MCCVSVSSVREGGSPYSSLICLLPEVEDLLKVPNKAASAMGCS